LDIRNWLGTLQRGIGESTVGAAVATRIRNQCDAIIANHLSDGPDFETNGEKWLAERIAEGASVFVDVGANVGSWAMSFLRGMRSPALGLLIEPGTSAIAALRNRFLRYPIVELVEAAASDQIGEAIFYEEPSAGQTSSLIGNFTQPGATARRIGVTTVDVELSVRKIDYVDMLKIDAEGYDFRVLCGTADALKNHGIGIIQFEYNRPWAEAGSTLASALKLLNRLGYTTYLLKSAGLYLFNYDKYGEYYAYSNFVSVAPHKLSEVRPYIRGTV